MIFKKRIHRKMMINFLGASLIVYIASLGYVGLEVKSLSKEKSQTYFSQESGNLSKKVEGLVGSKAQIVEALASSIKNYGQGDNQRDFCTSIFKNAISNDKNIISLWMKWEPSTTAAASDDFDMFGFDDGEMQADEFFADETEPNSGAGYFMSLYRDNGEVIVDTNSSMSASDELYFGLMRETKATILSKPYKYKSVLDDSVLIISVMAPIVIDEEFSGVVGMSFPLDFIQDELAGHQRKNEFVYLISDDSSYVFNPNRSLIGTRQTIIDGPLDSLPQTSVFMGANEAGKQSLITYDRVNFANAHWYIVTSLPVKLAFYDANRTFFSVWVLIIIGFFVITIVISLVANNISKAIVNINNKLADLSLGIIDKHGNGDTVLENEITDLSDSLVNLFDSLQSSVDFAGEIGKGNLDTKYNLLSEGDTLGTSLITMQKSLIKARNEEDKKKLLDDQRNWVTHGLANFGEIIRQENENVEDFAYNLLSQLLKYVDLVQGAIYFKVEDEYDSTLKFENKAAIAYGKQIMLETPIVTEQDGIFGRVIDEQKCIYLENVPNNYVHLNQGKKEKQRPNNLLVVPMVVNDVIYGIMELMSYNHLEQYQIEFIEKLCENIASVISSVNTNIHNAKLLEQSNLQGEELSQHEEEMRQNLEEMQATQEEATKRHEVLNSQIEAFYKGLMVAELDLEGRVTNMSSKMTKFYGISNDSIKGSSYIAIVAQDEAACDSFKDFWNKMLETGKAQRKQVTVVRGKELETLENYFVVNNEGIPAYVMVVAIDKTRDNDLQERLMIELHSYMQEHGMTDSDNN